MARCLARACIVAVSLLALTIGPAWSTSLKGKPIKVFPEGATGALAGTTVTPIENGGFMATWSRDTDADFLADTLYFRYFKANGKPAGGVKRYDRDLKGSPTRSAFPSAPITLGDGRQFAPWSATFDASSGLQPLIVGQVFKKAKPNGQPTTIVAGSDASNLVSTSLRDGRGLLSWYSAARDTLVGRLIDSDGKLGKPDLQFEQEFSNPIPLAEGFARIRTTTDSAGVNALCQIYGKTGSAKTDPFLLYAASASGFGSVTVIGLVTKRLIAVEATNNQDGTTDIFAHQFDLEGKRIGQVVPLVKKAPSQLPAVVETKDGGFVLALMEPDGISRRYRRFDDRLKLAGDVMEKRSGRSVNLQLSLLDNGIVAASYKTEGLSTFFVQLVKP